MGTVNIRKFKLEDIQNKIEWINNPANNQFLHYELPLEYDKTVVWYEKIKDRTDRYDAVIEVDHIPVGLIGLLSIDTCEKKAEYYISMGNTSYKGKGVAFEASKQLLEYAFTVVRLDKVYLYTEVENLAAQRLFAKLGFGQKERLKNNIISRGQYVDRYFYEITKDGYFQNVGTTPIQKLGDLSGNTLYIKREDLLPYSFGGNKARKAELFFRKIDLGDYDCVVTYGSSHSNHCRVISNMAAKRGMECWIIAPTEVSDETFNSKMMGFFGAKIIMVPIDEVSDTIDKKMDELKKSGKSPFFIPGGGHGNIGTQAYVNCFEEICHFERINHKNFEYVFFASGTGTTHAGLVCGKIFNNSETKIVGISIARKSSRGRDIVADSVTEYLKEQSVSVSEEKLLQEIIFNDEYIADGYGKENVAIRKIIKKVMLQYGIPMDSTYTAKAFYGMEEYIKKEKIRGKNILFIHTGGTPLFFDDMRKI